MVLLYGFWMSTFLLLVVIPDRLIGIGDDLYRLFLRLAHQLTTMVCFDYLCSCSYRLAGVDLYFLSLEFLCFHTFLSVYINPFKSLLAGRPSDF